MVWFLYIVAILFIAKGSFLVLHTERALELSETVLEKGSHRIWGITGAAFGIMLSIASFWSGVVWFLFLLGMMEALRIGLITEVQTNLIQFNTL